MVAGLDGVDANQRQNLIHNAHLASVVGNFKVKTVTNVRCHRLVVHDTNDGELKAAGDAALNVLGWVEFGIADATAPATWGLGEIKEDEDFAAGDLLRVGAGVGTARKTLLLDGESVAPKDPLVSAAGGKVRKYLDQAQPTPDDPAAIVGYAGETAAPSGADAFILVWSGVA